MANNAIATAIHPGLSPKLSGAAADVLRGDGSYGTVPGVGVWTTWVPTRTGWTDIGTPTVTARYCQIGNVVFFQIKIVPATTVASVAGTSYISLPVAAAGISGIVEMMNLTTLVGVGSGVLDVANTRAYVPSQGATANTLTISGYYEV